MNYNIIDFSRLVDLDNYRSDILEKINESLKNIFDADFVQFQKGFIKGNRHGFYLPVTVEGKNIGYYEIIGVKQKLSNKDYNVVISLLQQLYTKYNGHIGELNENVCNLVYDMNYLKTYQNSLDLNNLVKLNCLFISVYGYDKIVYEYGIEAANYMIKMTIITIRKIFKLPNDSIFQYANNQFVLFITNQTDISIRNRTSELKSMLNNDDINASFGLSSARGNFDLGNLILLAEQNICTYTDDFKKYY